MKKILFLCSIFPEPIRLDLTINSIGAVSNANNNFQNAIIRGLIKNSISLDIVTVPNIGAYPKRYKKLKISKNISKTHYGSKITSISWINLPVIKHYFIYKNLLDELESIDLNQYDTVISYDLYPPFYSLFEFIKGKANNIKIINIVPDIIGMTRGKSNLFLNFYDRISVSIIEKNIKYVDGLIYLTKFMSEKMPYKAQNIPSIIIEGIIDDNQEVFNEEIPKIKYILYSGSLDIRHGILNLINAFIQSKIENLELWICGDGDGRSEVEKSIKDHNNIKYLGQINREQVKVLQSQSYLLINPRNSKEEFTRYSFPSKIIEYFISGSPTFMYRLPGIPEEYFDYCFSLDDESVDALSSFLIKFSQYNIEELNEIGSKAKDFVIKNKNAKTQTLKIIELFEKI